MIFRHLRNVKGFFSDYYLGSVFGQGGGRGRKRRLSDRDTDAAYVRFIRIYEGAEGRAEDAAGCRERFVRPLVRDVLGYHLGAGEERIHGLYASAEAEAAGEPALVLCYCGAWDEDLDAGRGGAVPVKRLQKAMAAVQQAHGFLVTGERIRLVRPAGEGPAGSHLEVDLASLAGDEDPESFAAFYRLFHASQYLPGEDGKLAIERIEEESRRHAEKVSDDLKRVVFTTAETLVAALIGDAAARVPEGDPPEIDDHALKDYRDAALLAIYRMLFILYAEARDERLQKHPIYWNNYSIHQLVEDLLYRSQTSWPENRAGLWSRLKALVRIYDQGLPRINSWEHIPPRGSDFFKPTTAAGAILDQAVLPDRKVARLLLDLTTTRPRRGVGRERISFRELDIENLGAVYEGLLEYEPRLASETLIELRIQGRNYALGANEVLRLCQEKNLMVKGDPALVAGTAVESLHPAFADDEEGTDDSGIEVEDSPDIEQEVADESVKKGAPALVLRRFEPGDFYFVPGAGRKGSGSFYTPLPLVQDLVRHALGPLAEGKSVAEIESLRVLDAACGSAHFLVEAMRFLGRELHRIDQAETEALQKEGVEPESVEEQLMKDHQRRNAERILEGAKLLFDLRSASAFVPAIWPDWATLYSLVNDYDGLLAYAQSRPWWQAFETVREREQFFHWELEFPEVFLDPDKRGFDVILGNPPWDKIKPDKKEFYGAYDILIRAYVGGDLDRRIKELHAIHSGLAGEFKAYETRVKTQAACLKKGGDYQYQDWKIDGKSTGGDPDVFKFFVERAHQLLREGGRVGYVVPSALYNNEGCTGLRHLLLDEAAIERFYAFENRDKIFPIDSRYKFVSLVFRKGEPESDDFKAAFMRHDLEELKNKGPKPWVVRVNKNQFERWAPGSLIFPEFTSPQEQEFILTLLSTNTRLSEVAEFYAEFHSSNDKRFWTHPVSGHLFSPEYVLGNVPGDFQELCYAMRDKGFWPLYLDGNIHQFNSAYKPIGRWLSVELVEAERGKPPDRGQNWCYGVQPGILTKEQL